MLVGTLVSVVGSQFWYQDEISDELVGVGRVSYIKIIIFVMRGRFTVVALLPLTQNTLPSKDVREYVFSCFLMAYRSRDLPGTILNEFGISHSFHIFSHFSHFEWLVIWVPIDLFHVVWCLVHLCFDIKINV